MYPGDPLQSQPADADFKGIRAVLLGTTAAVHAGTGPVLSPTLKTFSSDSNLRVSMGTRNLSSTSLHTPPKRLGEVGSEVDRRPGTAHSMRGSGLRKPPMPLQLPNVSTSAVGPGPKSPLERNALRSPASYCGSESSSVGTARDTETDKKPNLHIDLPNGSTTTFGGTPKSPLGQYELPSPLKSPLHSDTDSLLGDDPGKIVDEIAARITREEKVAVVPKPLSPEERRILETELEAQKAKLEAAKKKLETAKLLMAYPSPPASIESERDVPGLPARKASVASQATSSPQEARLVSAGLDTTHTPSSPVSGASARTAAGTDAKRADSSLPTIETPPLSSKMMLNTDILSAEATEQKTNVDEQSSPDSHMLHPQQENSRGRIVTEANNAPRSPLFQQMTPFDIHSDEDYDDDDEEHMVDYRATNAPYGLPSPPLSHHQRPSKDGGGGGEEASINEEEGEESLPVLRTVQAKRDTTLVGAAGRTSLGLQIEEFEKSLQQAQAMSALENHRASEVMMMLPHHNNNHRSSRANSNASSAYSDLSDAEESPMVLEPPLISPKPFPLSPRPMGPRASTPATDASSAASASTTSLLGSGGGRPMLEVRSESPFGSFFESFTTTQHGTTAAAMEDEGQETDTTPTTPPVAGVGVGAGAGAARPRPRLGAVKPSRPTLGEYGPVKINTVTAAALAGRRGNIQRPSLDEYDVVPPRSVNNTHSSGSGFFNMESPIIKDMPRIRSPGSMTDGGLSSTNTSCTASPINGGVASYSVFSPPPPIKQRPIIQQQPAPPRSTMPEWYGPAPSAPPTSPLPIPAEKSISGGGNGSGATTPRRIPTTPSLTPATPGLRTSPSIVPDLTSNPNWPLPAPTGSFTSPPPETVSGFSARRSLLHRGDGRAPAPAPINIMATRYAEEVGGEGGPWTPMTATTTSTTAAAAAVADNDDDDAGFEIRSNFSSWKEEPVPHQRDVVLQEENIESIGLARGLSIKYDKIRERERRVRGHDKAKRMAIVTVDEDEEDVVKTPGPVSPRAAVAATTPSTGEPLDRLRRPNHGLKSPMGFADEQGIRFI